MIRAPCANPCTASRGRGRRRFGARGPQGKPLTRLTFLGTADAYAAGGRGHACYWLEDGLGTVAVDFGPTALMQARRFGCDLNALDGVFLTHLHGDHIGGLPVLLVELRYGQRRTRPFTIAGPPGTRARVEALWQATFPSVLDGLTCPIEWVEWQVPGEVSVLGRRVQAISAQHDRLAEATSFVVRGPDGALAFSGDTGWQPALAALVAGVDCFVTECSSVAAGYWGHLSVEELVAHRDELAVGRLVVSHLSDESRAAALAQSDALRADVADDGWSLTLPPG